MNEQNVEARNRIAALLIFDICEDEAALDFINSEAPFTGIRREEFLSKYKVKVISRNGHVALPLTTEGN